MNPLNPYLGEILQIKSKTRRAFLKTPKDVLGPKSYFMCRLFTNRDSGFVCF